jgi:hypothetical protein
VETIVIGSVVEIEATHNIYKLVKNQNPAIGLLPVFLVRSPSANPLQNPLKVCEITLS